MRERQGKDELTEGTLSLSVIVPEHDEESPLKGGRQVDAEQAVAEGSAGSHLSEDTGQGGRARRQSARWLTPVSRSFFLSAPGNQSGNSRYIR